MAAPATLDLRRAASRFGPLFFSDVSPPAEGVHAATAPRSRLALQLVGVFAAYYIAGKLGQATTNIRSSNLGPVWPAYGIALASFLVCGSRVWPGIAASAFIVAWSSAVPPLAAAGQAIGASVAALIGATLLQRIPHFDPRLSRLRDALGLITIGALGSATISASIGVSSLFLTHVQAYSGLAAAWLIYWLGDATGVLLVTPLVFTVRDLFDLRSRARAMETAALLALLFAVCLLIFGDLPLFSVRLHVLAFAVLPFVMWAAINLGIGGASLSVFIIATVATLATAFGRGPFASNSSFINAVLLDVFFAVLAITGLTLAAVTTERARAEREREALVREQSALEARLHLATIVDSSDDAIFSTALDGRILSWNGAAERTFGFDAPEVIGRHQAFLLPAERAAEEAMLSERLRLGARIERYETLRKTKAGKTIDVSLTISPLIDGTGMLVGAAVVARDISEPRRVQQALSSVSRRLIHAQEEERARIARELHDDIGQRLAMLAMGLADAPETLAQSPDGGHADRLHQQALEIASDLQALSYQLHSPKLEMLGLAAAMKGYCRELAEQQNLVVDFETDIVSAGFPSNVSLCFFRVLQEALHNAVKHSGARHFDVRLWEAEGSVHLRVSDPGNGFDVDAARAGRGLGLVSMQERLKLVAGELSVEAQCGRGTTVYARAPLP
jgi:PAS domain S-box-containing protein